MSLKKDPMSPEVVRIVSANYFMLLVIIDKVSFERSEKSNAKHCPERSEGSAPNARDPMLCSG
jgi:hypothetical protein